MPQHKATILVALWPFWC